MRRRNYFVAAVLFLNLLIVCKLFCWTVDDLPMVQDDETPAAAETFFYRSEYCGCERRIRLGIYDQVIRWCSEETSLMGYNQNVMAYSLYGSSEDENGTSRYYSLLDVIPQQVKRFYPDWRIRIYHNIRKIRTKEYNLLCDMYCQHDNVDLCDMNEIMSMLVQVRKEFKQSVPIKGIELMALHKKMWRYLAMIDPQVDRYMSRDTDSEIFEREVAAVDEWLRSDRTFHVMRDHQGHLAEIMGGLFGAKVYQRRDAIQGLAKSMVSLGTKLNNPSLDQNMMCTIFWPVVKDDAVIHDSYYCERDWNSLPVSPFPTQRINGTFVSDRTGAEWGRPRKCPPKCRPVDHQDWQYC